MKNRLDIAEVAAMYKISARTLRYYEEAGLLTSHRKTDSRYREYDQAQRERLEVILLLRRLSFGVREISELLCGDEAWFHASLKEKIAASDRRLMEAQETNRLLKDLTAELAHKPISELKVDELLGRYTYLTNKSERMVPMNTPQEKYRVNIGESLIPMVDKDATPPGGLLEMVRSLREKLAEESVTLPPVRIMDNINIAANEAVILCEGTEIWRKCQPSEATFDQFAEEIVRQIEMDVRK